MVSAVLLQIMTEGPIEKILYGNPQMTFFRSVYIRPTNFASKYSVKSPPGKVDWGQTIDIKVPREADLLGGVSVRIKLSDLLRKYMYFFPGAFFYSWRSIDNQFLFEQEMQKFQDLGYFDNPNSKSDIGQIPLNLTLNLGNGETMASYTHVPQHTSFVNGIGTAIIEHISIYAGSKLLEQITGEYIFLDNELTNEGNANDMFYNSINFKKNFIISTDNLNNIDLIVPIPFFFTKEPGSYLPIMAMNNEDIVIRIKLRNLEECVVHQYNIYEKYGNNSVGNQSIGKNGTVQFQISNQSPSINPFAEIDPNTNEPYAYIPPGVLGTDYNQQPLFPVDTNSPIKEDIYSEIEIFEIIYKFYHINREEQIFLLKNKHNYIIPTVRQINSVNFSASIHNSLEIPLEFVRPTKFFVFTLQRKKILNEKDYYNYTYVNKLLRTIDNGDGLIIDANHNNCHMLDRFNLSLDGVDLLDNIPAKLLTNIELLTKFRNNSTPLIYAYSFAINPNDYYPSGTLNFSQFMKQFIKLTTVDDSLFESDELIFNGYYVSYNILTIVDGLSGLRYV